MDIFHIAAYSGEHMRTLAEYASPSAISSSRPISSRQSGILICYFMGSPISSRQSGILIQRGPPRPRESSAEAIS